MMPQPGALACVGGQPGVAAVTLLRYRGDFDRGGLRIGNVLFGRLPVEVRRRRLPVRGGPGRRTPAERRARGLRLGPELAENKRRTGHAVEEERVLDDLLADLDRSAPPQ